MSYNEYISISEERYNKLMSLCDEFTKPLDSKDDEPVYIYEPLSSKQIDDLKLTRELSEHLQKKKDDYIKKALAAAEAEVTSPEVIAKENSGASEIKEITVKN